MNNLTRTYFITPTLQDLLYNCFSEYVNYLFTGNTYSKPYKILWKIFNRIIVTIDVRKGIFMKSKQAKQES